MIGRRPADKGVWTGGAPSETDSQAFVMEKPCLSRPSHPSPLLDPIINAILPPTSTSFFLPLPLISTLIPSHSPRTPPPAHPNSLSFVLLSSCPWSDYRADCTSAAVQSCISSPRCTSLFFFLFCFFTELYFGGFNSIKKATLHIFFLCFPCNMHPVFPPLPTHNFTCWFPWQKRKVNMMKAQASPKTIARWKCPQVNHLHLWKTSTPSSTSEPR